MALPASPDDRPAPVEALDGPKELLPDHDVLWEPPIGPEDSLAKDKFYGG